MVLEPEEIDYGLLEATENLNEAMCDENLNDAMCERKIAIYLRTSKYSGSDGCESSSIQTQRSETRNYASLAGFNEEDIVEFVDDGYSGTSLNRPAFIQLINEIEQGHISHLVVTWRDRLIRNYELGKQLNDLLNKYNTKLLIVHGYDEREMASEFITVLKPLIVGAT